MDTHQTADFGIALAYIAIWALLIVICLLEKIVNYIQELKRK